MTESMEKNDLRATVEEYMKAHNALSLATERDGVPHAASVFYVSMKFDLYFLSSPTSRHGENLLYNPRVSATINEDYRNWLTIKGLQLEGRAEHIGGIFKNRRIALAYVQKFPDVADFLLAPEKLGRRIAQKVEGVHFYRLTPSRLFFLNNEEAFGHREELDLC